LNHDLDALVLSAPFDEVRPERPAEKPLSAMSAVRALALRDDHAPSRGNTPRSMANSPSHIHGSFRSRDRA
jgi:hypothetical protein